MTFPQIQLSCDWEAWEGLDFDVEAFLEGMTTRVRARVVPWCEQDWEVSVFLTHDAGIQPLNAQHRGKDHPTNVLSFGVFEAPVTQELWQTHMHPGAPFLLGDIVLSYETLAREALEQEKPFKDHLAHLMVHGLLHLLGYDHVEEDQAQEMEALEIDILSGARIPNPYIMESQEISPEDDQSVGPC